MFHDNSLSLRGTTIALYDYAYYNQEILGNESIIVFNGTDRNTSEGVVDKFKKSFNVLSYGDYSDVDKLLESEKCDKIYIIKSGERNHQVSKYCDTLIHAVFPQHVSQQHGSRYAFVSEWLSKECSNYQIENVPHMINLYDVDENFRSEFGIRKDDYVFGRYGGYETFDIDFVKVEIAITLEENKNYWFVFMNTEKFINHPRVIFLNSTGDMLIKRKYINTCDFMIHARHRGESFGLSVLEFACLNKQIITYGQSQEKSHLMYLGENCHVYNNAHELRHIFKNIKKDQFNTLYLNDIFSPSVIMQKFNNVFLA
ncbi:MAG: glycosyltransferase family 1 protein [Ignavibacteria bacterium]